MAHYAIGDVQGCYSELMALLDKIEFNENNDILWFAGDIINGGKENLSVLRFISQLQKKPVVILGNHDLHFLAVFYKIRSIQSGDTFNDILNAPDVEELCHWLQRQSIAYYDNTFNSLIVHAGISQHWSLNDVLQYAKEIETQLNPDNPKQVQHFLKAIFGLCQGEKEYQWRVLVDTFTRIRFCDKEGNLNYSYKGTINDAPSGLYPWFSYNNLKSINILFGHWAALEKNIKLPPHLFALDTGCVWGGYLSALRLEDKQWFQVKGKKYR